MKNYLRFNQIFVTILMISTTVYYSHASQPSLPKTGKPAMGSTWNLPLSLTTSLAMAWIAPGSFEMGSSADNLHARPDESPQTRVILTKGVWLATTLVTIGDWKSVMGVDVRGQLEHAINDDTLYEIGGKMQTLRAYMGFSKDADIGNYLANENDNLPMYFVSWNDAEQFCNKLTSIEKKAKRLLKGYEYDLPTEAQWEYACRAGTTSDTYAGALTTDSKAPDALNSIAWYDANSPDGYTGKGFSVGGRNGGPHNVAQKQPNAWGLYDISGNIWEWCRDWYAPYPGGSTTDPIGPSAGTNRVNRGGSFGSGASDERSASRAQNPPPEASAYRGFRLALWPIN
jgi:formylglycine-generating enzyme required for sulfatase activity